MGDALDPRHQARKLAMGSVFCWLFAENNEDECMQLTKDLLALNTENADLELANNIVEGIKKDKARIDSLVEECAPEWPIDKISKIDLVILRIALWELLNRKDTPEKVVINEAIELAKEFGNDTSSKFVNGVLGKVVEEKKHEQ